MVKYVTSIKYPVERTRESDAWASAEGVTLSGVRKDKTECQGNSGEARKGAEGARRKPNLSGKRTETVFVTYFFGRGISVFIFFGAIFALIVPFLFARYGKERMLSYARAFTENRIYL